MSRAKVRRPGHVRGAGEDSSGQEEARMSVSVTSRQGACRGHSACQAPLAPNAIPPSQVVCSQVGDQPLFLKLLSFSWGNQVVKKDDKTHDQTGLACEEHCTPSLWQLP